QGASCDPGRTDRLHRAASGHDALWGVVEAGSGNCHGAGGRHGSATGGRALRLRGHALAAREGPGVIALALHRTQRRLATLFRLDPATLQASAGPRPTRESPDGSTINDSEGRVMRGSCTLTKSTIHRSLLRTLRRFVNVFLGFPEPHTPSFYSPPTTGK